MTLPQAAGGRRLRGEPGLQASRSQFSHHPVPASLSLLTLSCSMRPGCRWGGSAHMERGALLPQGLSMAILDT